MGEGGCSPSPGNSLLCLAFSASCDGLGSPAPPQAGPEGFFYSKDKNERKRCNIAAYDDYPLNIAYMTYVDPAQDGSLRSRGPVFEGKVLRLTIALQNLNTVRGICSKANQNMNRLSSKTPSESSFQLISSTEDTYKKYCTPELESMRKRPEECIKYPLKYSNLG